jgi:HSP20 family protein
MTLLKLKNQHPVYSNLMDDFFGSELLEKTILGTPHKFPKTNILELENGFKIELMLPGFKKEQIKIDLEKNNLVISAEVETPKEDLKQKYTLKQFTVNSFKRTFTMPENAANDKIEANYADGILSVHIAKLEPSSALNKSISIN